MYDISPIVRAFRKHHVKFISKKELGKKIPSISYNLRKGGSVLIDRKNGAQSIKEILKLGRKMEDKNWSVCIFPEGTRSKYGQLRTFHLAGFKTLLKASPNALIVPFAIDGNYKLHRWGQFPLNIGIKLKYTALEPIARQELNDEDLLELIRAKIAASLQNEMNE
jgi:1-acyl-sn-glycerol-3-phosphate acyltransferase